MPRSSDISNPNDATVSDSTTMPPLTHRFLHAPTLADLLAIALEEIAKRREQPNVVIDMSQWFAVTVPTSRSAKEHNGDHDPVQCHVCLAGSILMGIEEERCVAQQRPPQCFLNEYKEFGEARDCLTVDFFMLHNKGMNQYGEHEEWSRSCAINALRQAEIYEAMNCFYKEKMFKHDMYEGVQDVKALQRKAIELGYRNLQYEKTAWADWLAAFEKNVVILRELGI